MTLGSSARTASYAASLARVTSSVEPRPAIFKDYRELQLGFWLLTYALGRDLGPTDQAYLADLRGAWSQQGLTLRALLKLIVVNDTFRFRRGEANQ